MSAVGDAGEEPTAMSDRPAQEQQTYESAAARVEAIVRRLDSGEASLGETLELVKEGKALIEYCARELQAVGGALEELRLDELVARLEGEAAGRTAGSAAEGSSRAAGSAPAAEESPHAAGSAPATGGGANP